VLGASKIPEPLEADRVHSNSLWRQSPTKSSLSRGRDGGRSFPAVAPFPMIGVRRRSRERFSPLPPAARKRRQAAPGTSPPRISRARPDEDGASDALAEARLAFSHCAGMAREEMTIRVALLP